MLLFLLGCDAGADDTDGSVGETGRADTAEGDTGDTGDSGPTDIPAGPDCDASSLPMDEAYNVVVGHVVEGSATEAELADLKIALAGLLPGAGDLKPAELSGGMRKRAGLARALALDPELLFLDEPTAGLDPIAAAAFDELIKDLSDSLDLTVFMITHDLDTLYEITDRVAVLADGKVVATAPVHELELSDHPWIREYFLGPRGRAAAGKRKQDA